MMDLQGRSDDRGAARRPFLNECMDRKLRQQHSTHMLVTGRDDPTKALTAALPANSGSSATGASSALSGLSSMPIHFWLIGAAAAYFIFKKR